MQNEDPWAWMQSYDVQRLGGVILDLKEQEGWWRAVLLGGLPFMWRKAEVARNLIYDRLELRTGDKVLIIGECIEPCGFVDDMRQRVGLGAVDLHARHRGRRVRLRRLPTGRAAHGRLARDRGRAAARDEAGGQLAARPSC